MTPSDPATSAELLSWSMPRLRVSHVLAVGVLVLIHIYFGALVPLAHTEIWADLKHGQWILQEGTLPGAEPFALFTDPDQPFRNHRWLAQACFYIVFSAGESFAGGEEPQRTAGGVATLRGLLGLLMALKTGLLMLALWRVARSLPLAILGALLAVILTFDTSQILRAQSIAEVCFAFLLWQMSARRLRYVTWVAVPLLFSFWANVHESFLVGLTFLSVLWLSRLLEWALGRSRQQSADARLSSWLLPGLGAVVLSVLAAGLLNPQGFGLYDFVWNMKQNPIAATDPDWAPLNFSEPRTEPWVFFAALVVLIVSQALSPRSFPLARMILLLVFAVLALYQQRLLVWWLTLAPWFAVGLWFSTAAAAPRKWRGIRSHASRRNTRLAAVLVVAAVLGTGPLHLLAGLTPSPLSSSTTVATLWQLAAHVKEGDPLRPLADALAQYPSGKFKGRILAQGDLAGYLIWSLPVKAPVVAYSQAQQYPEVDWERHETALLGKPGWRVVSARYDVNLIVFDPRRYPELAKHVRQHADWTCIPDEPDRDKAWRWPLASNARVLMAVRKTPMVTPELKIP